MDYGRPEYLPTTAATRLEIRIPRRALVRRLRAWWSYRQVRRELRYLHRL